MDWYRTVQFNINLISFISTSYTHKWALGMFQP